MKIPRHIPDDIDPHSEAVGHLMVHFAYWCTARNKGETPPRPDRTKPTSPGEILAALRIHTEMMELSDAQRAAFLKFAIALTEMIADQGSDLEAALKPIFAKK